MRALTSLVCEGLTEDAHTHQFSAFKIVGAIHPRIFPVTAHRLAYLVIFDHDGPEQQALIDLQAVQDGEVLLESALELPFRAHHRSQAAWVLDGLRLTGPGTLHIKALHQGVELASYPIQVVAPPPPAALDEPPPPKKRRTTRAKQG